MVQLYEGAAGECTTFSPLWPDLVRPPTSSEITPETAGKAWMAGPSPATGISSCVWTATQNRFRSTEQQWVMPGQDEGV